MSVLKCKEEHLAESIKELPRVSGKSFDYSHKWEGIVDSFDGEEIIALLTEVETGEEDEFIFSIDTVPQDDRKLVEEGALFNFYIGFTKEDGSDTNTEYIKFRRNTFTKKDMDDILDKINDLDLNSLFEHH